MYDRAGRGIWRVPEQLLKPSGAFMRSFSSGPRRNFCGPCDVRVHPAGMHQRDPDACMPELLTQRFRKAPDREFGRAISNIPWCADQTKD